MKKEKLLDIDITPLDIDITPLNIDFTVKPEEFAIAQEQVREVLRDYSLYEINSGYKTACVLVKDNTVIRSDCRLAGYMRGWTVEQVIGHCKAKGWSYRVTRGKDWV